MIRRSRRMKYLKNTKVLGRDVPALRLSNGELSQSVLSKIRIELMRRLAPLGVIMIKITHESDK